MNLFKRFQYEPPPPPDHSAQAEALNRELEHLREMWAACLWGQKLPHYPEMMQDPSCRRAEREAFQRMKARADAIKRELHAIQQKEKNLV